MSGVSSLATWAVAGTKSLEISRPSLKGLRGTSHPCYFTPCRRLGRVEAVQQVNESLGLLVQQVKPGNATSAAVADPALPSPAVDLTASKRIAATVLNGLEWLLSVAERPLKDNFYLAGNYAPVEEMLSVAHDLSVTGNLPECLNGQFLSVAPNPKYPPTANYHWFDGDGMIHAVRIKDGKASYVRRYVETSRLMQEDAYGRSVFIKSGDMKGFPGLLRILLHALRIRLGLLDASHGAGPANTSVVYHHGNLMALQEADAPYVVRVGPDGDLRTIGRYLFGGALDQAFTAHPKIDPVTGEMFCICVDYQPPSVTYRVVGASGSMGGKVVIPVPSPVLMHDVAVTETRAVIMDLPFEIDVNAMIGSGASVVSWKERPSRFGVLPRYATSASDVQWFELPPMFVFHTANAWDEGDEVVLLVCRYPKISLDFLLEEGMIPTLWELRFNVNTGHASQRQLAECAVEYPRVDERLVGRKSKYVYAALRTNKPVLEGVVKFDTAAEPSLGGTTTDDIPPKRQGCVAGSFVFGSGRSGAEPVFVPRASSGDGLGVERTVDGGEGDNGYLVTWVYDRATNKSEMVVIDVATMVQVAAVHLPTRVPEGFHGTFVSEEQLAAQRR